MSSPVAMRPPSSPPPMMRRTQFATMCTDNTRPRDLSSVLDLVPITSFEQGVLYKDKDQRVVYIEQRIFNTIKYKSCLLQRDMDDEQEILALLKAEEEKEGLIKVRRSNEVIVDEDVKFKRGLFDVIQTSLM